MRPTTTLEEELIKAARSGDVKIVTDLLKNGVDVNVALPNGSTALMLAAQNGHAGVVTVLLENGANFNLARSDGWTALMIAAQKGHAGLVAALLEKGANVNSASRDGWTALMIAAQNCHAGVVAALLEKGADVNLAHPTGTTALMFAAANGHAVVVNEIITNTILSQRNNGADWRTMAFGNRGEGGQLGRSQLTTDVFNTLSTNTHLLILFADRDERLGSAITTNFNQRNPQNPINLEASGILGAGVETFNQLTEITNWHRRYLVESGVAENEATNLAHQKLLRLINNPRDRQAALERSAQIVEWIQNPRPLVDAIASKEDTLAILPSLTPEERHRLTTSILENSRAANGGVASLQDQSLVVVLQNNFLVQTQERESGGVYSAAAGAGAGTNSSASSNPSSASRVNAGAGSATQIAPPPPPKRCIIS